MQEIAILLGKFYQKMHYLTEDKIIPHGRLIQIARLIAPEKICSNTET